MKILVVVGLLALLSLSWMNSASAVHGTSGSVARRNANPKVEIFPELNELQATFGNLSQKPISTQVRRENGVVDPVTISKQEAAVAGLDALEEIYIGLSACEISRPNSTRPQADFLKSFVVWLNNMSKRQPKENFKLSDLKQYMLGLASLLQDRNLIYSTRNYSGWNDDHARYEAILFSKVQGLAEAIVKGFRLEEAAQIELTDVTSAYLDAADSQSHEKEACLIKPSAAPATPAAGGGGYYAAAPATPEVTPSPTPAASPEVTPSPTPTEIPEGGGDNSLLEGQKQELDAVMAKVGELAGSIDKLGKKDDEEKPKKRAPEPQRTPPFDPNMFAQPNRNNQGTPPQAAQPAQPPQQQQATQPPEKKKDTTAEQLAAMQRQQQGQGGPQPPLPGAGSSGNNTPPIQPQPTPLAIAPTPTNLPDPNGFSKAVGAATADLNKQTDVGLGQYMLAQQYAQPGQMGAYGPQQQFGPQMGGMQGGYPPPNPLRQGYNTVASWGRTAVSAARSAITAVGNVFGGRGKAPSMLAQ